MIRERDRKTLLLPPIKDPADKVIKLKRETLIWKE